jgi:5-methylcytosine-specific restriction endonuclease McrA
VLGRNKQPLMPCHPARARQLLKKGRAAVYRRYPFTILLKERKEGGFQPIRLKFDPGAKTTGACLVGDFKRGQRCIFAMELTHRGKQVKKALEKRRGVRRSRRYRKTRFRKPRFKNRRRRKGWLPPSLQSRVDNIASWVNRFQRLMPLTQLSMELVRFDTQAMENPEIKGIEYQQGELLGYEVREYLLEKWGRKCAYCKKEGVPLQIEHMTPKSRGGSNRVSNLTLACGPCNQKKGKLTAKEFGFPQLEAKGKKPLKSAAIMNATRYTILNVLKATGLPVECGSGGRTKYNRSQQKYPKAHWLDAMCVGESGQDVFVEETHEVLEVKAMGRGSRQMCLVNKQGFPRTGPKGSSLIQGFRTGDLVRAFVPKGKKLGKHEGRVAVRSSGSFNIMTRTSTEQGISWRYCRLLQRVDGYAYTQCEGVSSQP